jgi:hypothetical protein
LYYSLLNQTITNMSDFVQSSTLPNENENQNHEKTPENVYEAEKGKKIVLGTIAPTDKPRSTSPRTANRNGRKSASPQRKSRPSTGNSNVTATTTDKPATKFKEVSESLMKPTAARVRDGEVLDERKRHKSPEKNISPSRRKSVETVNTDTPPSSASSNVGPSERLLRPTQSRISEQKEWQSHKERSKYEDDIWWELRKPAELAKVKPGTPSKLTEPTASFAKSVRPKYDAAAAKIEATPPKESVPHPLPAPINVDSPLLKKTYAATINSWKQNEIKHEVNKPVLDLPSQVTGPQHVSSKLSYDTKSSVLNKWKSKEQLEKQKQSSSPSAAASSSSSGAAATKKVKEPSSRLLELNESTRLSQRPKAAKSTVDPRESGWHLDHKKPHIPTIDDMHDAMIRTHSAHHHNHTKGDMHSQSCNSTILTGSDRDLNPDSSGSAMNSHDDHYDENDGVHEHPHHHHQQYHESSNAVGQPLFPETEHEHEEQQQQQSESHFSEEPHNSNTIHSEEQEKDDTPAPAPEEDSANANNNESVTEELTHSVQSLEVN